MATNSFDLIVFDWDGTLMDSEARIVACIRAAVADLELDHRDDDAIRNIIGLGLSEAIETLYPGGGPELHRRMVERYRHHFLSADPTPSVLFGRSAETVQTLSEAGYLLAVATGKGRQGLDQVLVETGLGPLFHTTRCADETFSKPHPQMLEEILEVLGVEPQRALMVGDTEYDMLMAQNARVPALAVSYGVHAQDRLMACDPLGCIHDIGELIPWLEAFAGSARPAVSA